MQAVTPTPQEISLSLTGLDIGIAIVIGFLFLGLCIVAGFVIHGILSKHE